MKKIAETSIPGFVICSAEPGDEPVILDFITRLAVYEKLEKEVVASESDLKRYLFGSEKVAEVIIGVFESVPVGFALFFHNFSTFLGKPGIYLEDLFVLEEYRGRGFGKSLLSYLAKIAVDRNCGRLEWAVLDWNEPSIRFYKSIGARIMNEWLVNRLTGAGLKEFSSVYRG